MIYFPLAITDAEYAAALLFAVPPSDRALAGWGGHPAGWAAWHLRGEARRQEDRDAAREWATTPRRSTT